MKNSKIEWTDHTFNPWRGCTKVSPGCAHCYAETLSHRNPKLLGEWGPGKPRVRASAKMWQEPLKWNRESWEGVDEGVLLDKNIRRQRVFCASLADWLDHEVPAQWLSDLLYLAAKCSDLDWLFLTKRPGLWRSRMEAVAELGDMGSQVARRWLAGHPLAHFWIGTSVEDQARADERIPQLLQIPARVRFLSCEPLLGPVFIRPEAFEKLAFEAHGYIDWVICGGESGPGARRMHPDWARSLRDQCQTAQVPFFFKQWGNWAPKEVADFHDCLTTKIQHMGNEPFYELGKKLAGRVLDGRTWDETP
jgi:protein gp37